MTAGELMEFLKKAPSDAVVVVNGEIVINAILCSGRVHERDAFGAIFHRAEKGRDQAVMFLHHAELSDGSWVLAVI